MRDKNALTETAEGVLCSITKRVMIISPLPDRVRSLLVTLSAECFDIFSIHEFNKGMLPTLQPELLVYDALPIARPSVPHTLQSGASLLQAASEHHVPVLVLLDEQSYAQRGDVALAEAELLVWPAEPEEALRRINRMLEDRPSARNGATNEEISVFKDIRVDHRKMTVHRGDARIELTKTEYDLLLHFITSDGSVMSRESLLDTVWGLQFFGGSNVVDVHIKSLRKKLRDSAVAPKYIVTVRGAGYRLAEEG